MMVSNVLSLTLTVPGLVNPIDITTHQHAYGNERVNTVSHLGYKKCLTVRGTTNDVICMVMRIGLCAVLHFQRTQAARILIFGNFKSQHC